MSEAPEIFLTTTPGALGGAPAVLAALQEAGVRSVADVLARAEVVRELADRSNHVLTCGDLVVFVKRTRRGRAPRSALEHACVLTALPQQGVRTAPLAIYGQDPGHGEILGTLSLAPARPLDDVLAEDALSHAARRCVLADLARTTARLHDGGWHHKDLYLCHVFVDADSAEPTATLIDMDRLGRHRVAWSRWVIKDLAALHASAADDVVGLAERLRFFATYLRARGLRPSRWRARRVLARIERKARRIRRHVPRTPVGEAARP